MQYIQKILKYRFGYANFYFNKKENYEEKREEFEIAKKKHRH